LIVLLSACAQHKPKLSDAGDTMENRNAELIREQQILIEEQTAKIDQLTVLQQQFFLTLDDVQEKLTQVQKYTEVKLAEAPVRKLKSIPVIASQSEDDEPVSSRGAVEKTVVGRIEWVWIDLFDHIMKARVDTGVLLSTLSAENIQPFERNGEQWVSFSLKADAKQTKYEAPVIRYSKTKQSTKSDVDRRPVVKMVVRLGELLEETEFTLTNKNGTSYPVQLGRSFLRDIAVVDVSKKYMYSKDKLETRVQSALTQANQK